MECLVANFAQISSVVARFLFVEGRMGIRLFPSLSFSLNFLIS